jgi:hypothetical protein
MSVAPSSAVLRCCRQALKLRSPTTASQCTRLASTSCTSSIREHRRRKAQSQPLGRRWETTDAAAVSPKISGIVDQISQLTLLETADLVQSLKVRKHLGARSETMFLQDSENGFDLAVYVYSVLTIDPDPSEHPRHGIRRPSRSRSRSPCRSLC